MKALKLFFSSLLISITIQAQEAIITAGSDIENNSGSIAYSIGQVFYTSEIGINGEKNQGVQHAYEIFTVGKKETSSNFSLLLFPNPTSDILTLKIEGFDYQDYNYQLYDMHGKLIDTYFINSETTKFDVSDLPTATYLLNILKGKNHLQSFKIIKN